MQAFDSECLLLSFICTRSIPTSMFAQHKGYLSDLGWGFQPTVHRGHQVTLTRGYYPASDNRNRDQCENLNREDGRDRLQQHQQR